jgi:hypothetical protein
MASVAGPEVTIGDFWPSRPTVQRDSGAASWSSGARHGRGGALGRAYGVLVAIALSILDLLRRIARARDAILGFVAGLAGLHDVDDYPAAKPFPGLVIYRYDAPLCFANAEDFRRRPLAAVESWTEHGGVPVRWFVLDAEANVEVDITAVDAVEQLRFGPGNPGHSLRHSAGQAKPARRCGRLRADRQDR